MAFYLISLYLFYIILYNICIGIPFQYILILHWGNSKMKKYKMLIPIILLAVFTTIVTNSILCHYESQKFSSELAQVFDEVDRKMAVETLSELRGRVFEIQLLVYVDDISLDVAQSELRNIIDFPDYDNPYLAKVELTLTEASAESICDELISQIDDQIDKIWYGD